MTGTGGPATGGRHEGQVVIVTGGTSGIGKATATVLCREGAGIVVVDIDKRRVNETVSELADAASETPLGLALDVRSEEDMEEMVRRTVERFGRIDTLVHCAGILRGKGSGPKFLHQVAVDEWDEVIDTNLKGTFLSNRAVLPFMFDQGGGHIINFSSTSGLKGRAYDSVYCASKFGVVGLSEALAEEVRQYNVKVHVIMPDAVDTPIWNQNGPIRAPKDSLSPESVAHLVSYIMSLPADTVLRSVVIEPFRARRRKRTGRSGEARS